MQALAGKSTGLFKVGGISISLDSSCAALALLVAWSTAAALRDTYPSMSDAAAWSLGTAAAAGLGISILIHELGHAWAARSAKLAVSQITLFMFGGIAELRNDPPHPRAEWRISAAGPAASFALGAVLLTAAAGARATGHDLAAFILDQLATINLILAVFNLLPAFPLDGGRILRAVLWRGDRDLLGATALAVKVGNAIALGLASLGALEAMHGFPLSGVWYLLLGLFLHAAGRSAYMDLQLQRHLHGKCASDFMTPCSRPVGADQLLSSLGQAGGSGPRPVFHNRTPVGYLEPSVIARLSEARRAALTAKDAMTTASCECVPPESDAAEALAKMESEHLSSLWVAEPDACLPAGLLLRDILVAGRSSPPRS